MTALHTHVEALIFCAQEPVTAEEICRALAEAYEYDLAPAEVVSIIEQLQEKFAAEQFAFQINATAGGYQFLTKPAHQGVVSMLLRQRAKKRLSAAALETLAIIAYKQPITKTTVEQIRGVSCDYAIQKLLEKELVEIRGKAETVGKPILYGTTQKFMDYFGLNSLKDLPQLKEVIAEENAVGEAVHE